MTSVKREPHPTVEHRFRKLELCGVFYARIALGAAFLSAVASRFGLWHGQFSLRPFGDFLSYTAEVNSFMPAYTIPFLAWSATVAETSLAVLLILGVWPRPVAISSAVLLAMFGTAMAISLGPKSPLDYSVFSASSAALLLALRTPTRIWTDTQALTKGAID
jgi:uncharacterized membrane protein YphA (DoxX/SURF4 family)